MALIDGGTYIDGTRLSTFPHGGDTDDASRQAGRLEWIGLLRPNEAELTGVAERFDLHPLAIEDAGKGHQRAKLERYGATLFVVLRPAWYVDKDETVEFGEVDVFAGPGFIITVRHENLPDLAPIRRRLEARPQMLARGSEAVLAAILDEVVDGYAPVIAGVQHDIDEIEDGLFGGAANPDSSKRIYQLLSEVIGFQRAIGPLPDMLTGLLRGAPKYGTDEEVQNELRNVLDHSLRVTERVDTFRALLESALTLHSTLVTQQQNDAMHSMTSASLAQGEESRLLAKASMEQGEEVKRISAWAAILFAPTLIASIYGMNFDIIPELHWSLGYPLAIALMIVLALVLYLLFKRKRWL